MIAECSKVKKDLKKLQKREMKATWKDNNNNNLKVKMKNIL